MTTVYKLKSWDELINTQFNKYDRNLKLIKSDSGIFPLSKEDYDKYKNQVFHHNFKQFDHYHINDVVFERWMIKSYDAKYMEDIGGRFRIVTEIDGKFIDLTTMEVAEHLSEIKNSYKVEISDITGMLADYDGFFDRDEDYSKYTREYLWKVIDDLAGLIETTVDMLGEVRDND